MAAASGAGVAVAGRALLSLLAAAAVSAAAAVAPAATGEGWGDGGHCSQNYSATSIHPDPEGSRPARWLAAHNHYRACHGVRSLSWSPALAAHAKAWVKKLLGHCKGVADTMKWVQASGDNTTRPHDPDRYTTESPMNGENLYMRQHNSADDRAWRPVESWYREVETQCTTQGRTSGCGRGVLNNFTAMIWRDAGLLGCYAGIRGHFRVASCRYASRSPYGGTRCEPPNTAGPPNGGCQEGAETAGGPEVPPLLGGRCPALGGKPVLGGGSVPSPASGAAAASAAAQWKRRRRGCRCDAGCGARGDCCDDFASECGVAATPTTAAPLVATATTAASAMASAAAVPSVASATTPAAGRAAPAEPAPAVPAPSVPAAPAPAARAALAPAAWAAPMPVAPAPTAQTPRAHAAGTAARVAGKAAPDAVASAAPALKAPELQRPRAAAGAGAGSEAAAAGPATSSADAASSAPCIRTHSLGKCERCLTSEQCGPPRICCPFMKKCVKPGSDNCYTPIAYCQPPCHDSVPLQNCTCRPEGTTDAFPEQWQRATCREHALPLVVAQPVALAPGEQTYMGRWAVAGDGASGAPPSTAPPALALLAPEVLALAAALLGLLALTAAAHRSRAGWASSTGSFASVQYHWWPLVIQPGAGDAAEGAPCGECQGLLLPAPLAAA